MTASGGTVSIFSTASIAKGGAWRHIAFTYDGAAVRLYIDGALDKGPVPLSGSLRMTAYDLSVGSFAATSTKFKGSLDEIQIWDRSLSLSEIGAYFNVTNAGSPVAWLDMEHRDEINQLVDFSGANHPGIVYGTTVVEGRKGFGRKLAGPSDGIAISGTSDATFFATAVSADVYVLVSSMPVSDVSLVARTSQFYLNLTSDGRLQWSLYKAGTVTSPLPIPLNRWVRATGTAAKNGTTASTLSLYVDGTAVSSSNSGAYPTSSSVVTVGYTERTPEVRLKGSLDELLLMGTAASSSTVRGLGARGILLNPNATDTDGDGLADGQESSVITVRTPKRYPVPDQQWMLSDPMTLSLSAPGWALQSATLMTGFTHPDMGQIEAKIFHNAPSPWSRLVTLRYYGNVGQANNFTSYDLLNLGFARDEFVAGGTWSANVYDKTAGGRGQIEYYQIQLTMHTLPNRADTDSDGLNDSEEVGLGHDGYLTNPWKADTDGDGILDGVEANGWSWRVSDWTMVNDSTGFRTDPTNPDTDRDGTPDGRDGNPLADLFADLIVRWATIAGSDPYNSDGKPRPFVQATIMGNTTYTAYFTGSSGTWNHQLSVNIPDDIDTDLTITLQLWDYDSSGGDVHHQVSIGTSYSQGYCQNLFMRAFGGFIVRTQRIWFQGGGGCGSFYGNPLNASVEQYVPIRTSTRLIVPADYAGVYNVTDSQGHLLSRRYVGEPRFVAVLLNITEPYPLPTESWVVLVPRSVFFDTLLYQRLNASNPTTGLGALSYRQNFTSASWNADDLQAVLSGNLTWAQWAGDADSILNLLAANASGSTAHIGIDFTGTDYATDRGLLYSLPDGVIHLIGYRPFPSTVSMPYRFCSTPNCGSQTVQRPWWEQVWEGIVSVVTAVVTSAIVLAVTAFQAIDSVLHQVGNWLWTNIVGPGIAAVASAVRAAGEVLEQVTSSILGFVEDIVRKIVDVLLRPILGLLQDWASEVRSVFQRIMGTGDTDDIDVQMLGGAVFNPRIMLFVEILATGIEIAIGAVTVLSFLAPSGAAIGIIFKKVVLGALKAAFENMILSTIIAIEAGAIIGMVIPKDSPVWGWTSAIGTLVIALLVSFIQAAIAKRYGINPEPLDTDRIGLIFALLGFFLSAALLISGASGMWAVIGAWTGAVVSGAGLLIALIGQSWNDKLDEVIPGLGFVDELVAAGSFGFAVGVAATTR